MSQKPGLLKRSDKAIRFSVDAVEKNRKPLTTTSLRKQLQGRGIEKILACSHMLSCPVIGSSWHPLVQAVHIAYSRHYPLQITPDAFWLTVAQGFALHIANNAELLRDFFVVHQGKEVLKVYINSLDDAQEWETAVTEWGRLVAHHVGQETVDLFTCDFSTSTPITQTASRIVMMDGLREYFDYRAMWVCGIPEITVTGSVEDWVKIRQRVEQMAFYDLDWWTCCLLPICDELVLTASGDPSLDFWQDIYLPLDTYGGEKMTGWLKWLFPYVKDAQEACKRRNHNMTGSFPGFRSGDVLSGDDISDGLSRVPFVLETLFEKHSLQLLGGFLGVQQHPDRCMVEPLVGWGVSVP